MHLQCKGRKQPRSGKAAIFRRALTRARFSRPRLPSISAYRTALSNRQYSPSAAPRPRSSSCSVPKFVWRSPAEAAAFALARCRGLRVGDRFSGNELENPSACFIGEDIKRAVGSLTHVTDAFAQIGQQIFFSDDSIAAEREPRQALRFQCAIEEAAFPGGEKISRIERQSRGRDGGIPVIDGLIHAGLRGSDSDLRAGIIESIRNHRPAVIVARLDYVDLIAALRAMLLFPQFAGCGIDRQALGIAVAERPDFRFGIGLPDERIVVRD